MHIAKGTQVDHAKTITLWGLSWGLSITLWGLWCLFAVGLVYHICGNPLDELALIRRAKVATGVLDDTFEIEEEDSRGSVHAGTAGVYIVRLADGREFKTVDRIWHGRPIDRQEIEYLPDNPAVSRIKGSGNQSVGEWLWRKIGLGSLLLAAFLSPGIVGLRGVFKDIKGHLVDYRACHALDAGVRRSGVASPTANVTRTARHD